jgi:glycosyltransferase involved in cell wall biosynthesis
MDERGPGSLRVVQVAGYATGGTRSHVRELAAGLALENRVILAAPGDVARPWVSGVRSRLVDITDRPRPQDAKVVSTLRSLGRQADVVHAHGLRAGALAALALAGLPTPLVVTLHNLPVGGVRVRTVSAVLERIVARSADAVLGVSGDLVALARGRGARLAERALVPSPPRRTGVPLRAEQRGALGLDEGVALVLTVARLAPQKGLSLLADAAGLLAVDGGRPLVWAVAGDGPLEEELRARVDEESLPVRLLGRRDDVPDLLASADVVVSTSAWEGQPLGVQEALAAGVAVVATDVGGTAEVTGEAAVLVPYPDAVALAAAVRGVVDDDARRAALAEAARARAAELPRLADVLVQLESVYDRVLG